MKTRLILVMLILLLAATACDGNDNPVSSADTGEAQEEVEVDDASTRIPSSTSVTVTETPNREPTKTPTKPPTATATRLSTATPKPTSTESSLPANTPTVMASGGGGGSEFVLASSKTPPEDVLQEIAFYGGGGGPGGEGDFSKWCDEIDEFKGPTICLAQDGINLHLYNFESDERVRLFAYDAASGRCSLVAWQEFQVDDSGQLVVQLPTGGEKQYRYIAVGEISGERMGYVCSGPDCLESLRKAQYVAASGEKPLDVYESLSEYSDVVAQVAPSVRVEVIGTEIGDWEVRWWHVRLEDGTEGWVSDYKVKRLVE